MDTKPSHQFKSTQDLHQIGARLFDAHDLLGESHEALKDGSITKKRKKEVDKMINQSIMPIIAIAASAIHVAANIASPIGSSKYTHDRAEARRKKALASSNPNKRAKLAMIDNFVNNHPVTKPAASSATKPTQRSQPNRKQLPTNPPPVPANGHMYGIGEFLQHYFARKGRGARGRFVRSVNQKLIQDTGRENPHRYVKVGRATIFRKVNAHKAGTVFAFDEEWDGVGRRPYVKDKELKEAAEKLKADPTNKKMRESVKEMLIENIKKRGGVPVTNLQLNTSTVSNYVGEMANMTGLSLAIGSVDNTNARHAAERSLIGSMQLLVVIAMTHFYVTDIDDVEYRTKMKEHSADELILSKMVSQFHGNRPVRARPAHLIITVDDSTIYATEGTQPDRTSEIGLVGTSALSRSRTLSLKNVDNSTKMHGTRIKRHFMGSGDGTSAPPVWIITGLPDYEMPHDDFLVIDVEGLCIGGYGVGGSKEKGYIILMKSKKGMEKVRFAWVQENILIPFVAKVRKQMTGFVATGGHIPECEKAVFWCDGDNSQIDSIVSEEGINLLAKHGIIANKHNPSRTGSEQAPDLNRVFPTDKKLNKKITVKHVPSDKHDLKRRLQLAFEELANNNGLRLRKQSVFVDFFAKQPQIISKSHVPDNIVHGLVANGMLDPTKKRIPVFANIVGTIRRVPNHKEVDLCKKSFQFLMAYSYYRGMRYIPDSVFYTLGFPKDIDSEGKVKVRLAEISQENQQRCKCLTGAAEVASRAKRKRDLEVEEQRKEGRTKARSDRKKSDALAVDQRLCSLASMEYSEANVAKCEMVHFSKLRAPELRSFIVARDDAYPSLIKTTSLYHPKTALQDAQAGAKNCVSVAFACREKKSKVLAAMAENEATSNNTGDSPVVVSTFSIVLDPSSSWLSAGDLLLDASWLLRIVTVCDPDGKLLRREVNAEAAEKATLLCNILRARMRSDRYLDRVQLEKRQHWALEWAFENVAVFAAYMVLFGQVKKNIACIDELRCILARPDGTNFLMATNIEGKLFGGYLAHDENDEEWIRSGKSTQEGGCASRWAEHKTKASSPRNDSDCLFYDLFPSKQSPRSDREVQGYFEDLQQYISAGFDGIAVAQSSIFMKEYSAGGIFFYTKQQKQRIERLNFRGRTTVQKYSEMVAYLIEISYGLALGPKDVSGSAGFESAGLKSW